MQVPVRHPHCLICRVLHACSHHGRNALILCFVAVYGPNRVPNRVISTILLLLVVDNIYLLAQAGMPI